MIHIFRELKNLELCKSKIEKSARKILSYFWFHNLKINSDKTEILVFGNETIEKLELHIDNQLLEEKNITFLAVVIDNNLKYKKLFKQLLWKMAQSFKDLYTVRDCLPNIRRTMLIHALILSHLQNWLDPSIKAQNLIITLDKKKQV